MPAFSGSRVAHQWLTSSSRVEHGGKIWFEICAYICIHVYVYVYIEVWGL